MSLKENIFVSLGAEPTSFIDIDRPKFHYYIDGGTDSYSKMHSLNLLGWKDKDGVVFYGYKLNSDHSNIVPNAVSKGRVIFYLSPGLNRTALVSYGNIGENPLYIQKSYSSSSIHEAFEDFFEYEKVFLDILRNRVQVENPYKDSRFFWNEDKNTWVFENEEVDLQEWTLFGQLSTAVVSKKGELNGF